ncbi:cation diffusion facilitator family transporter [Arthrobacter sp. TMS2-4]
MTEASEEHRSTGHGPAGGAELSSSSVQAAGSEAPATESRPVGRSRALVGPFTLREVLFGGGVLLVFIGTLLPFLDGIVRYENFWNTAPLFFVGIGILLPVIALALVAGRRLGSSGLRVGSLSVDQFASVSSVLAATYFFLQTVTQFHAGPLVALIGGLIMLTATVLAPFLPVLKDDFADRPETSAHPAARSITAAQPRPAKPVKDAPEKQALTTDTGSTNAASTDAPAKDTAASGFRFGRKDKSGVNPAAAGVLQNGAGLYGAGGAGAVGAGAAAAGQSGMEPRTDGTSVAAGQTSTGTSRHESAEESAGTSDDASRSTSAASEGGAHAVEGRAAAQGTADDESSSTVVQASSVGETRVHEAVREEPAPDTAQPAEVRDRHEPITATRSTEEEPVIEAFWFAVGSPRPVFDEQTGHEVFTLQPGDWEVGIEDRGTEFLVQDKRTGAVGILRNLRNIERAPQD